MEECAPPEEEWRDVNQSGEIARAVAKWVRRRSQRSWQAVWKVVSRL
jgi:hypothetical protein